MKPPIVPSKEALRRSKQQQSEANPYALLCCNFDKQFYDKDIEMWKVQRQQLAQDKTQDELL